MQIGRLNNINNNLGLKFSEKKDERENLSFSDILKSTLKEVNDLQILSSDMKKKMAVGEIDNLHDVAIIGEKANIALQATMAIRTKVIEAYKEIMRLQI